MGSMTSGGGGLRGWEKAKGEVSGLDKSRETHTFTWVGERNN